MVAKQLSDEYLRLLRDRAGEVMRDADALTAAMAPLALTTHRWEPLMSCPDAGVDVDYEVLGSTFVMLMEHEDLQFALHRPDGEGGGGFEVRVIRRCPGCDHDVPFDPRVEDRASAGKALVAGRPWRHHHCVSAGRR